MKLPWKPSRADLLAVGVMLVQTLAVFWQGLIQPAMLISEDAAYYYQPYYTYAADEIHAGRIPLWNPYTNLGLPFHASLQASLFYPLRWPALLCDFVTGYTGLVWSHYFLTAVAAYLLLRIALRVGPLAGLLGAMSIAFGGFAQGHLSHMTYFLGYPWFLGCILFVWLAVQRERWIWTVWAGVCIGLLALIGSVHLLLVLGVLLGTYVAYHTALAAIRLLRSPRPPWRTVLRPGLVVAGAMVLGALLGSVQLLPARAVAKASERQDASWQFINMACAHPVRNTIQLVAPFFYGNSRLGYYSEYNFHDMAHFTGTLILVAAVVGVVHLGRDRHLWFLVVLAVVGFLVGAGQYLPVYRVLYDWVPGFGQLRNPTRIYWCTDIALACLAAVGIDRALRQQFASRRGLVAAIVGSAAVLVVLASAMVMLERYARDPEPLVRWVDNNPNVFNDRWKPRHLQFARELPRKVMREFDPESWTQVGVALAGAVALPLLIARRRQAGSAGSAVLVVLLGVDLLAFSFGTIQYERLYYPVLATTERARWLQENLGQHRYMAVIGEDIPKPDDDILRNHGMMYRIRNIDGVGGGILDSRPRAQFCALARRYPPLLNLCGVRYVFIEGAVEHPALQLLRRDERYSVYENRACLPMAFFVKRVRQAPGPREMMIAMTAPTGQVHEVAYVFDTPPPETRESSATISRVLDMRTVPGHWRIQTETDAPAQLLVSEGWDAGWRCRIRELPATDSATANSPPSKGNSVSVPVLATNSQLMSVAVPKGRCEVALDYAPPEFRTGAFATLGGLAVVIALPWIASRWSGKPRRPGAGPQ